MPRQHTMFDASAKPAPRPRRYHARLKRLAQLQAKGLTKAQAFRQMQREEA